MYIKNARKQKEDCRKVKMIRARGWKWEWIGKYEVCSMQV
jgi:hypothetical protein